MKNNQKVKSKLIQIIFSRKVMLPLSLLIIALIVLVFAINKNNISQYINKQIKGLEENVQLANESEIGEKGKITSAQIIQTKTGTGPFDDNDEPGNDSTEDNNIVRSFDQVTWTVDLTMKLKDGITDTELTGGIINIEVSLPENLANLVSWDINSMNWIENGEVSSDGRILTGKYSMLENIPGKQTLVFVLQVEGAGNKTEIIPTFNFYLEGNQENEKATVTGDSIIVSAKGKYNIQLVRNNSLSTKATVDYGEGNTEGKMYGYSLAIQLYNENESKGLKGMEYPKGDITFDIDLKLQRSKFETEELEDITNECTPILWNYRLNDWNSDLTGNIEGRKMFSVGQYQAYYPYLPLGKYVDDKYSTYNSGNISIVQQGSTLKVKVSDYSFNGTIFPHYEANFSSSPDSGRDKVYTDNIGTFSIGYMQIFVPSNEASSVKDKNYYLTVSDDNLNITTITNEKITEQMNSTDDSLTAEHVLYSTNYYYHQIILENTNWKIITSNYDTGDGKANIGQRILAATKICTSVNNDKDIYTLNRFLKFDGEGLEPTYFSDGSKYIWNGLGDNPKFNVWYVTKKDGTNWESQEEMNNADIEDMDLYETIEEIPDNKTCIGIYAELYDGYIYRAISTTGNHLVFSLRVKETATIGKTYGITQRTQLWTEKLDRSIYTATNPDVEWPDADWDTGHRQYIKTEYDENGEIIEGTHSGAFQWGQSVLAVGANLHGNIKAIDENSAEKVNYDLGKNENIVTYSVEPQLDANTNITSQISDVTLKAEVTLAKGIRYVVGSSEYGNPKITNNDDGTQTLEWYIYGAISGKLIDPITFDAQIDNESENGTQYTTKFVVSEVIEDGISKIGNSEINFRTSTETINIINLESHRLYKEVETPVIEKNGQITYKVVYENKTDEKVEDFQLLDILPFNGDSRGTKYNGEYTLDSVKINQTINGTTQGTSNLKVYTTNSEEVKRMTAKDEGIGTDSIWKEKAIGSTINESAKGIGIKGNLEGRAKLEIEITLNTNGNEAEDVYENNAMAQVYKDSEQMQTGTVQSQVVNRKIEGKVWEDSNENGIIDNEENSIQGITLILLNSENNQEVGRTTSNEQGKYSFVDLNKGKYKVKIEYEDIYYLTKKNVGDNIEINSKFDTSTKETEEIETLNKNVESTVIEESNINAGLVKVKYDINTKVEGEGGKITGQDEEIYESVNKGENSKKDIIITPNYGYKVSKITVNGEEIEFTEEENHNVTLNKFINMQQDKTIVVSFEKIEGIVITHHYIEGTKQKVPALEGGVVEDEVQTGYVGDEYSTKQAENIANNYEYVSNTGNTEGQIKEIQTEVIYYYKLKDPTIEATKITKESNEEKITEVNQKVEYNINYETTINNYIGKASITIVDELPYEIDEEKSNIAGGTYNKEEKTITWVEEIDNIDTFISGAQKINIEKEIGLVYKDIDVTKGSIENKVTGKIKLETPEKEETVEDTKEIPTEYLVNIKVQKIWEDNDNISKKRPNGINVIVKNGTSEIRREELNDNNNWTYTFENLPKYDNLGNEIKYTVNEEEKNVDDLKFYAEGVIEGSIEEGYTITNKFEVPKETIDITVNKVWEDNETQEQRRPKEVTINVLGENNKVVQSYDLKVEEETSHTFKELPKYNNLGNEIQYKVKEEEKNPGDLKFYTSKVEGTTITNTFTRPTDTVDITANKVWNDNEEQSKRRPKTITLVVKNASTGEEVESKILTKDNLVEGTENKWTVEFEGLKKYNENGEEIQYILEEKETDSGDLKFYEAEENNVKIEDNQATIRNNFIVPKETTSVTVNKVWNDDNNVNGRRPESIKLQVKNGDNIVKEQIINENTNKWSYTFTDLPKYDENGKEIEYTAQEEQVKQNDLKFYTKNSITGNMEEGYTIENTFTVPNEKIELTVNKVWQDNSIQSARRPDVVTINVLGESKEIVQTYDLNIAKGEESHTFKELPKYNNKTGKEIEYTVEEKEKNLGDLDFYTSSVGSVENISENVKQVTITNKFVKPDDKTKVTVTKTWNDNEDEAGKRPESIKLLLKNGNETIKEEVVSGNTNVWEHTFEGLAKYNNNGEEIKYTVDETEVNPYDLQFYEKQVDGLTITNTFTQNTDKINIPITKIWEDNEIQKRRRPESVIIVLKSNGVEKQKVEIKGKEQEDENRWKYVFEELPKYDAYNNIINYTIEEQETNNGDLKFYTSKVEGYTITNTFTKPEDKISIEVNKKWEDQENIYNKRPVSIRLEVKEGENIVKEKVVTKEDNWKYTFTGLEKYDENGQEINYEVDEEEVIGNDLYYYTKEVGNVNDKAEKEEKEATIINKMTKIPSKVIVKYIDKNTGEEITDSKAKEGIIGEKFDVTEDKKEIPGYTLVEEPKEKTGIYTEKTQEKIYYYAKNTEVIVKYLEKGTNKILASEKTLSGYVGQSYSTAREEIEDYTLVETTNNTSGKMQEEKIIVIYYYAQNTKVTVKYLEKGTNKELAIEETINGYEGKEYETEQKQINDYTFVESTKNTSGQMTKEEIEVIYYYAQNTSVIVKYLEKDTNTVLADEVLIEGYEGKEYETEQKQINDYTFVESTKNTSGQMTKEKIEVIYYYAQNTKAKVQHIDRETGKILKEETKNGKVGDIFNTHSEDFEGYVLVEEPENKDIIMDKTGEQVVKYYYAHISAGLIEKHIDVITGELLYSSEHKGNEGDPYNVESKEFTGYDLVEDKLPNNSSGTMKRDEVIEVKYYYIRKTTVIVEYVDENTGEKIEKDERIEGHENDSYETKEKEIEGYNLTKTPENAKGTMTITKNEDGTYNTEIKVTYYYKKISGGVIENHIDIDKNKKLATQEHEGNVGDQYDIPSREFEGYDLVTDMLPNNSSGTMQEEEIVVNYYYKKQAKVRVEYIDKKTGEKLDEEEIKGHIGDSYETEEKEFDGYDLIEKPSNDKGEMKEEEIVVKYYYQRKAEVEVKYLEKGTEYEILEPETIKGYVGDKYETEQKDIAYYKFVEKTENWKGEMQKDKITVIYYYEKEIFNLGVDKWVESVNVNGISTIAQNINNSDEIYKVDIHRSKADTAQVKITYKIRITNKGEVEGKVERITDIIPAGYTFNQEDNDIYWENNNGVLTTDALKDEVIQEGEYKEIEVTLRCNKGTENFGQKDNTVILTNISNPAGYEDIDKEDNNDTSSMILTIATGLDRNDRIVIIGIVQIVLAISIGLLLSYKKKQKTK